MYTSIHPHTYTRRLHYIHTYMDTHIHSRRMHTYMDTNIRSNHKNTRHTYTCIHTRDAYHIQTKQVSVYPHSNRVPISARTRQLFAYPHTDRCVQHIRLTGTCPRIYAAVLECRPRLVGNKRGPQPHSYQFCVNQCMASLLILARLQAAPQHYSGTNRRREVG